MKSLHAQLLDVQKELIAVRKEHVNPHFGNKHMHIDDVIDAVRPILNKHQIVLLQPLTSVEGQPAIQTILYDPESEGKIEFAPMPFPPNLDAQKMVAASTYLRRASLVSLFLIQGEEDDDGNSASGKSLEEINAGIKVHTDIDPTERVCPKCYAKHHGKFPKCYSCYMKDKKDAPPF
jgi:hypothetical protein